MPRIPNPYLYTFSLYENASFTIVSAETESVFILQQMRATVTPLCLSISKNQDLGHM